MIELLEQLAALDSDLIKLRKEHGLKYWELPGGICLRVGKTAGIWDLFGAICERIGSRHWWWAMPNDGTTEDYVFTIRPGGKNEYEPEFAGFSNNHPAHAAALAYLAALNSSDTA